MANAAKMTEGIPIWRNVSRAGKVYFKMKLPDGQAFVIYKNDHWTEGSKQPFMRAFEDKPQGQQAPKTGQEYLNDDEMPF